jgi:large subunit ribosomal protein L20
MARVKGGPVHSRRRKRVLKNAKGFMGGSGTIYRAAIEFTRKAGVYAYRDRRQKKRHFRSLWISRLNAALKERGILTALFQLPAEAGIELNRKMLRELAVTDPAAFEPIVEQVRSHAANPAAGAAAATSRFMLK